MTIGLASEHTLTTLYSSPNSTRLHQTYNIEPVIPSARKGVGRQVAEQEECCPLHRCRTSQEDA